MTNYKKYIRKDYDEGTLGKNINKDIEKLVDYIEEGDYLGFKILSEVIAGEKFKGEEKWNALEEIEEDYGEKLAQMKREYEKSDKRTKRNFDLREMI